MTKSELANKILDRKGPMTAEVRQRWFNQLMAAGKAELIAEAK